MVEISRDPGRSIAVWAARGGHGATTVAGVLGVFLQASVISHDPDAFRWVWNDRPKRELVRDVTVCDAGVIADSIPTSQINVIVLRGPCSLALRELSTMSDSIDHLILLREPWRPLRARDAEDALGLPVAVEIPFSARLARLTDAGLLASRISSLDEFSAFGVWAQATLAD